jgi:hypothetical protein
VLVLVLGAGDGRGFGGFVSPAKLALADSLDPDFGGFELRIHGVGLVPPLAASLEAFVLAR